MNHGTRSGLANSQRGDSAKALSRALTDAPFGPHVESAKVRSVWFAY